MLLKNQFYFLNLFSHIALATAMTASFTPVLNAKMIDYTGSFAIALVFAGIMMMTGGCFALIASRMGKNEKNDD